MWAPPTMPLTGSGGRARDRSADLAFSGVIARVLPVARCTPLALKVLVTTQSPLSTSACGAAVVQVALDAGTAGRAPGGRRELAPEAAFAGDAGGEPELLLIELKSDPVLAKLATR